MGILQRLAESAGDFVNRFNGRMRMTEAGAAGGEMRDVDEDEFRRVGKAEGLRDITRIKHDKIQKLAYRAYLSNPPAKRGIDALTEFVVGDGFGYRAPDPEVQNVLKKFWLDPVNRWDIKQHNKVRELSIFGEQFYPAFVDPNSGRVRLGYIDPSMVEAVVPDEDNVEVQREVVVKATEKHPDGRRLKVIQPNDDPNSPNFGRLEGEIFVWQINKVSNATRGNSDLIASLDWLATLDDYLMGVHEAAILKTSVIWDVMVKGANPKKLKDFEKNWGAIKKGMTRYHNENVVVTNIAPDLDTADLGEHARLIKTHGASGMGMPLSWLSDTEGSNRATAAEQTLPTTKRLRARQILMRNFIAYIFDFVVDQAIIAKRIRADVNRSLAVFAPQIWAIDVNTLMDALNKAASALSTAQESGWLSEEGARLYWTEIANQLGLGIQISEGQVVEPETSADDGGDDEDIKELNSQRKTRVNELGQEMMEIDASES